MPTYSAERQKPVTNVWSINFTRMFVLIPERQELALCPFRPFEHQASHTTHRRRTKTHTMAMVLADGLYGGINPYTLTARIGPAWTRRSGPLEDDARPDQFAWSPAQGIKADLEIKQDPGRLE